MTILKKYRRTKSGQYLTLSEIMQLLMPANGIARRSVKTINEQGIEIIANSPAELKTAALEMTDRLDGKWASTPDDDARQDAFWKSYYASQLCLPAQFRFAESMPIMPTGRSGERALIGSLFLKENIAWMLG